MSCFNVFLILLFMFLPKSSEAIRWLALYTSEGNWTEADCGMARRGGALWGAQARACRRQPGAMPHVAGAARAARAACLAAHAGERWNCSSVHQAPEYPPDLLTGTREQAYVYAMSAAALAWSLARACAAGALPACSCAAPPRAPPRPPRRAHPPHAQFKWGGCGDNFQWAERFAKQFLDMHEINVRDGNVEEEFEEPTTSTESTTVVSRSTPPPVVILVDDQPAPAENASVAPRRRKGRRGRKRLPRSPRRGRPTRKRFRPRYEFEKRSFRYRNLEYRMAADDPRFDPQVDLRTRLRRLRPLIASANLVNTRFGRKVERCQRRCEQNAHATVCPGRARCARAGARWRRSRAWPRRSRERRRAPVRCARTAPRDARARAFATSRPARTTANRTPPLARLALMEDTATLAQVTHRAVARDCAAGAGGAPCAPAGSSAATAGTTGAAASTASSAASAPRTTTATKRGINVPTVTQTVSTYIP